MLRILSLDGGGVRGLSSLIILREIMCAIQRATSESNLVRPCDVFQLIVGTGSGGISAILLGRMQLTVDQAILEYIRIADNVFRTPSTLPQLNLFRPVFDHKALTDLLNQVVKDYLGDSDALIFDPTSLDSPRCRTAVLAATKTSLDSPPFIFRSYSSTPHFKLTDVAQATFATTGIFPAVSLGFPPMQFVDASTAGYNNPTEVALEEAHTLWPGRNVDVLLSIGTGIQKIVGAGHDKLAELSQKLIASGEDVHERVCRRLPAMTYFRFNVTQGMEDVEAMAWGESALPGRVAEMTSAYLRKAETNQILASCMQSLIGTRAQVVTGRTPSISLAVVHGKQQATLSTVFHLRIRAFRLPHYRSIYMPNCFAHITVDDGPVVTTSTVSGFNPEWMECFDVSLKVLSTIVIKIFHITLSSEKIWLGTALVTLGHPLHENETVLRKLHQAEVDFQSGPSVEISLSRKSENEKSLSKGMDICVETSFDVYKDVVGYVNRVVKLGDVLSQVYPYAHTAWMALTYTHKVTDDQSNHSPRIKTLLLMIRDTLEFLEDFDPVSKIRKLQDTVSSIMVAIHECGLLIQSCGRKVHRVQIMGACFPRSTVDERIEQLIMTFDLLKEKFNQGVNIQIFNTLGGISRLPEDAESKKLLEALPGWSLDGVKFNESKICLDGTRKHLLEDIRTWAYSPEASCILWLSGGAGTGKTSVANSTAVLFDKLGCLAASFYFNHDTTGLNSADYLFGNLCYQLAHYDEHGHFHIKSRVLSMIRSMGHISASSLQTQARKLIVDTTNGAELVQPVVMVIDALDQSGTIQTRRELLDVIATEFPKLPRALKIIITSRDESDIRASLEGCSREVCIDDVKQTPEDIAAYIKHRLGVIRQRSHLGEDWPGLRRSQELTNHAGNLFIWASVACSFVENKLDPVLWLDHLLEATTGLEGTTGQPLKKLYLLYNNILRNAFPDEDDPPAGFHYVVGSIIVLEHPLTRTGLDSLLGLRDSSGRSGSMWQNDHNLSSCDRIISRLGSILRTDSTNPDGKEGPLRLLHPSVYDFLTTQVDGYFQVDPVEANQILALCCLSIMNSQLRFDICQIGDRSLLNKEIKDLPSRIAHYITDGLCYSCCSFEYHLTKVLGPDVKLRDALREFFSEHLLHWIETMSLLGKTHKAEACLYGLSSWIQVYENDDAELQQLVRDAVPFLTKSGDAVQLSALHTYYSALPLVPKSTSLFNHFIHNVPHAPNIIQSHKTLPTAVVKVLEGHTSCVSHVVFSPDGRKLASASADCTVRLWDVESGQAFGEPLKGHMDLVPHVIFSPDGKKLASGSFDKTVRLWNTESSQAIGGALKGHTGIICHIAFSPDGKRLASASWDKTLWLWNIESHQTIGQILKGHTSSVYHVVFSPDGKRLVSSSTDGSVWMWSIQGDQAIGKPLQCHTNGICHIAFSPDGKKLASASKHKTVQLWDSESGKCTGQTLIGHTSLVHHVAFSPDAKKLASVSDDKTVWLWNIDKGKAIGTALKGHTDWVIHVVFSPDGIMLASVSNDQTVRLWDANNCQPIGAPLRGHTSWVHHVIFSPDGTQLASASWDNTVRLWNVYSSQHMQKAFEGHKNPVRHIVFSPDGQKLASVSNNKAVQLWDVTSGQVIGNPLKGHTNWVCHVAFSPDSKKLASASLDKTVQLWDTETRQAIGQALNGHTSRVTYVVFSPGEKLASVSNDKTIRLWDVRNVQAIGDAFKGHTDWVSHVAFSPNGQRFASASFDETVQLWSVNDAQAIGKAFRGHTNRVYHVMFSPDGKKLASASHDMTVCLWDIDSGQAIGGSLKHTSIVNHVVFSPDGKKLASASNDKILWLWDIENDQCISQDSGPCSYPVGKGVRKVKFSWQGWISKAVYHLMSFDKWGFLCCGTRRLLWLPVILRGCIVAKPSLIAVGGESGAVTFIHILDYV